MTNGGIFPLNSVIFEIMSSNIFFEASGILFLVPPTHLFLYYHIVKNTASNQVF